ncbi:hypothetical protein Thpro_021130 [Acidihalobacter prosperus]|uniref:Uncharacterized protein n=1 Tax=Acidihalobacter prosperus TaxID=160660 RepID=A0A1A6C6C1_9GAMM|nr:hypothetical protein Thpro_021130 [Acidihalobacter prosperus]
MRAHAPQRSAGIAVAGRAAFARAAKIRRIVLAIIRETYCP